MKTKFISLIGIFCMFLLASTITANTTFDGNPKATTVEAVAMTVASHNFSNPVITKIDYGNAVYRVDLSSGHSPDVLWSNNSIPISDGSTSSNYLKKDELTDAALMMTGSVVITGKQINCNVLSGNFLKKTSTGLSSGKNKDNAEETDVGYYITQEETNKGKSNQEALAVNTKDGLITAGIFIQHHNGHRHTLYAKRINKDDGLCTNITGKKTTTYKNAGHSPKIYT